MTGRQLDPDLERLRRTHPGWRIWQSGARWYAYGPGLGRTLLQAASPEQLDAELTKRRQR